MNGKCNQHKGEIMKIKMKVKIKSKHFVHSAADNDFTNAEFRYITTIFKKYEKQDQDITASLILPIAS